MAPRPFDRRARRHRHTLEWLACLLAVLALAWTLHGSRALSRADLGLHDAISSWATPTVPPDVVVVAVDDDSLKLAGRWPWPRSQQARLLDALAAAEPLGVAVNVIWSDASAPEEDMALVQALRRLRGSSHVVLPVWASDGRWIRPLPIFADEASGLGHLSFSLDSDGKVRRLPLFESNTPGQAPPAWPALAAATWQAATPPGRPLAFGPADALLLSWDTRLRTLPASAVLRKEVPAEFLRGKWVVLGLTATALGDRYPTPSSPGSTLTAGVQMHGVAIDALLHQRWKTEASPAAQGALGTALLLLWMAWLWRLGPVASGWVLLGWLIAVPLGSALAFHLLNQWWPPLAWLCGIVLAYVLWNWRRSAVLVAEVTRCAHQLWPRLRHRQPAASPLAPQPYGWHEVSAVLNDAMRARTRRDETLQWLSHDLRAPQSAILALLFTARQEDDAAIGQDLAKDIEAKVRETLALADDFILHARAEEQEPARKDVELGQMLYQAREMALPLARERHMKIHQEDSPDDGAWVLADPRLLERAVSNLLGNAIHYGTPGSEIRLGLDDAGDKGWRVWVSNHGPGLTAQEWEQAFEPRRRLASAGNQTGHGLGLPFVKTVALAHGGEAWGHSDPATGVTQVGFFIPRG